MQYVVERSLSLINRFPGSADDGEKGEGSDITCCAEGGRKPIDKSFKHPECFEIEIPRNDPFYARLGQKCMEFVRSMPAERPECNLGPREQVERIFLLSYFIRNE